MRTQLLRGFYLGDALVEPLKGQVSGCDGPEKLPPEAVDVLLHLASEPRQIIEYRALLDEVWGRNYGSQESLALAVQELRRVLCDTRDDPLIESIAGRGYRLNCDVRFEHFPANGNKQADAEPGSDADNASQSGLTLFWQELKKRRVVRVAIGYVIVAWALLQVADILFEIFQFPDWSMKLFSVLLALGFVVTLVVAWLLQITPTGIQRDEPLDQTVKQEIRHYAELAIIVVLLVAVGILSYRQIWDRPPTDVVAASDIGAQQIEKSIAVLPFQNLGEDAGDHKLGHGLAEEILHKLVRIKSLKVAARTSSFYYDERSADIPTIAAQMLVGYVLEGSVRREGNRIRVTAQLLDKTGFHVWSRTFDVKPGDMLDVQSELAVDVAREVATSLTADERLVLESNPTENEEAFFLYLQGLEYLRKGRSDETLGQAAVYFERALNIDSRYARAYAGVCEVELARYRINRDVKHFENAERACNRALTLDSGQVEVYTALGNLYRHSSQYEKAQVEFEHALQLNPYYEEANYGLAKCLQGQGLLEEAEKTLRISIELEPGYWGAYQSLGVFLYRLGRYADAISYFEKVTELMPDNPDGWTNLGAAYYEIDDWESANVAWSHSLELDDTAMGYRNLGTLFYYQGRYAEAAEMHQRGLELAPDDHRIWGRLAAAYRYIEDGAEISQDAYRKAINLAYEQLELDELNAETMANLAAYYTNIGVESEAVELISRAIGLEPENPEIWYFSGLVNARLGQNKQAVSDLQQAADLGYSRKRLEVDPQLSELREIGDFQALYH